MDSTAKIYKTDDFEDYTALLKTANLPMTITESTVRYHDPDTFRVILAFAPFYEVVREMAMYNVITIAIRRRRTVIMRMTRR